MDESTTVTPTVHTVRVKRGRYSRLYEIDGIETINDGTAVVRGRAVYRSGKRGRPRTIGLLLFDKAA